MSTLSDETTAFFFMGEGSATFVCSRRKETKGLMSVLGYRITPRIAFTNTDPDILHPITKWLRTRKIHFIVTVQRYNHPRYLPLTIIRIERFKDAQKILEILLPYLLGKKLAVCQLMLECLSKYGGRGNWSDLMREKVVRDKRTGRFLTVIWDVKKERQRFFEIMKYRDKIADLNGGYRAKYNSAFFANLWGLSNG